MKTERPPRREFAGLPWLLVASASAAVFVLFVALLVARLADSAPDKPEPRGKAVIIDQLGMTAPNPQFVSAATTRLRRAGYEVDYIAGERVTVDLYRYFPSYGYDIVVLRAHAGRTFTTAANGDVTFTDEASLFTGETYDAGKHTRELDDGVLGKGQYFVDGLAPVFAVGPAFVYSESRGSFDGALVILAGCDTLRSPAIAQAFFSHGAGFVAGWDDRVSAPHMDAATLRLLDELLAGAAPADAASRVARDLGPDPTFRGELRLLAASYPAAQSSVR